MSLLNIFKRKKTLNDYIEYYILTDWWQNRFTDEEKEYITNTYKENSSSKEELFGTNKNPLSFLIAMYKITSEHETVESKVESKIYDSFDPLDNSMILEMHSFYEAKIKSATDEKVLIGACYTHINFAPRIAQVLNKPLPSHIGYEKLSAILEKQKKYDELIKISEKALSQGWAGDWEKKIKQFQK